MFEAGSRLQLIRWVLVFLALLLSSCANVPIQEMSNARQALQAARQADAARLAPVLMEDAERQLQTAEQALEAGQYENARSAALAARKQAILAGEKARQNKR